MATTWALSRQIPLALLPFVVYSIFHVATYIRSNILPALQPPTAAPNAAQSGGRAKATGPVADAIGKFIKEYYDMSMTLVAVLEILLLGRLLGSAILFQKGSWILLAAYAVFLRARFAQSTFVQAAVANLSARGDAAFANKSADPRARSVWEQVKKGVVTVHDATDLNRYVNRGAVAGEGAKKAQ
jgi:transmembrane protein 33